MTINLLLIYYRVIFCFKFFLHLKRLPHLKVLLSLLFLHSVLYESSDIEGYVSDELNVIDYVDLTNLLFTVELFNLYWGVFLGTYFFLHLNIII